jgi:succinate dehydrogenase hydrophobic anchor subunit
MDRGRGRVTDLQLSTPAGDASAGDATAGPHADRAADEREPPDRTGDVSRSGGAGHSELPFVVQMARTTGLLLGVLVPVHLGSLLVRDPETVDAAFLIDRWSNPAWLLADWGLLAVGTLHAVLSLWARLPRGERVGRRVRCPSCDEEIPLPPKLSRGTLVVLVAGLTVVSAGLFLTASWGMLRLL